MSSEEHKSINTQRSKIASYSYPDIKYLHLTLIANLTKEKQPRAQHVYVISHSLRAFGD